MNDKPLINQRFLCFYVQRCIVEAMLPWGYIWGYDFPEVGVFPLSDFGRDSMALTDTEIRRSKPGEKPYKLFDSGGLHLWSPVRRQALALEVPL